MEEISAITKKVMNDPKALAMMQSRLDSMVGSNSGYFDALPEAMKKRVRALRKMQLEFFKIESKYYEEVHELETKYHKLYQPLYVKRSEIVNALYEPTEEECDFPDFEKPSDDEDDEDDDDPSDEGNKGDEKDKEGESKDKKKSDSKNKEPVELAFPEDTKGIPEFWLTILKSTELTSQNIQDKDDDILKNLIDVKLKYLQDRMGYVLEFYFKPNEYFEETLLTKTYHLKIAIDEKDPMSFDGPEITKCTGCDITWKSGKNPTLQVITKKQKHKTKGSVRTITEELPCDSFFNFFDPPKLPEDQSEIEEDVRAIISADYEIAEMFRHHLIPKAVLFYTGEATMDDEDDFDEYDDDSDDDEEGDSEQESFDGDEEEDGESENERPPVARRSRKRNSRKQPQECKQQ